MNKLILTFILLLISTTGLAQKGQFMSLDTFKKAYFSADTQWQTMWVDQSLRVEIEKILQHPFNGLRIRYWQQEQRSGWIFEEVGKELPITAGVVIEDDTIEKLAVLEYRESRGGEVRYPFFTDQFDQASIVSDAVDYRMDKDIDGITGATLSVRALKRVALLALFCHQQIMTNE